MRARIGTIVVLASVAAGAIASLAITVTRTPAFHAYADQRAWLGIPHAGDVLSNLPFVIAGAWGLTRARERFARLACLGVIAIGIGSGAYHVAPGDMTLAFDWGPIALALMLVTAAVIEDRLGARAGRIALVVGPLLAVASVVSWIAAGGTGDGAGDPAGSVTPYGAVQALGIALPAVLALIVPGAIPRMPLLLAVALFVTARLCAARDRQLLDAIGVSGHSMKHIVAAGAAALALAALTSRASSASRSSS